MGNRLLMACLLVPATLVSPATAGAQDLIKEAWSSFPRQTIRVEYSRLAKLRALPNYESLHQRFVGPRLQVLESALSQLGIRESDIDDVVLGWQASGTAMGFAGLASGRFNSQAIAERAGAQGLNPTPAGGLNAYCFEARPAANCVAVLSESRGAFGTLDSLTALLETRQGQGTNLGSDDRFVKLLNSARTQASIWGVAIGPGVVDWFKGWMAGQSSVQLDWSRAFQSVESLAYSVDAADKVQLEVRLDCSTPEAASSLRQVFEGLKLVQQLAWQNQNPNQPNPYESLGIGANDRQVSLQLTAAYAAVEGALVPGSP